MHCSFILTLVMRSIYDKERVIADAFYFNADHAHILNATRMLCICCAHALRMKRTICVCYTHDLRMLGTCYTHAIHMLRACFAYVRHMLRMLRICYAHALRMLRWFAWKNNFILNNIEVPSNLAIETKSHIMRNTAGLHRNDLWKKFDGSKRKKKY